MDKQWIFVYCAKYKPRTLIHDIDFHSSTKTEFNENKQNKTNIYVHLNKTTNHTEQKTITLLYAAAGCNTPQITLLSRIRFPSVSLRLCQVSAIQHCKN